MEHTADACPLNTVQQCVVNTLATASTLTDAAALHRARAELVLARRDDLLKLSNRALETLPAILDTPRSSVHFATSATAQDRLVHAGTRPRSRRQ
jgi:hypothetical protein